jgi:adenylyltransferase/sulfurtransferase
MIQATETIKLVLGSGEPLIGRLLPVDALAIRFRELKLRKNLDCPARGTHPTVAALIDYSQFCGIRGEETPSTVAGIPEVQPKELKRRLVAGEDICILDVREPHELRELSPNIGPDLWMPIGIAGENRFEHLCRKWR